MYTGGFMAIWTDADVETLKAKYLTTGIVDLAAELGRSRASIYLKANALKLIKLPRRPKVEDAPVSEG